MKKRILFLFLRARAARWLGLALGALGVLTLLSACASLGGTPNPGLQKCNNARSLERAGLRSPEREGGWWKPSDSRRHESESILGQEGRYLIAAVSPKVQSLTLTGPGGVVLQPKPECIYRQLKAGEFYHFEAVLKESTSSPGKEIRLFEVWSSETLQAELGSIQQRSNQSSPWLRDDPMRTLKGFSDSIVTLLAHDRVLAGVDPDAKPLDQASLAAAFARAANRVAESQAGRSDSSERIYRISRALADEASSRGYDELSDGAGCLADSLKAERLEKAVEQLADEPARRDAERIDEIIKFLSSGKGSAVCDKDRCTDFPRDVTSAAVERVIDLAAAYATEENPCSQDGQHQLRLSALVDLLASLERRCWIEASESSRLELEAEIRKIQTAVNWRERTSEELDAIARELAALEELVASTLEGSDVAQLGRLQEQLEGVSIPELTPPDLVSECRTTKDLTQRRNNLKTQRLELGTVPGWYERFQRASWVRAGSLPTCADVAAAQAFDATRQEILCKELNKRVALARRLDCSSFRPVAELLACTENCASFGDNLEFKWQECREELAVDDARRYLVSKSEEASCAACEDMVDKMRELRSGAQYQQNAALRLDSEFGALIDAAGERIKARRPANCRESDLDPRPTRTGGCCDVDVDELIRSRRQNCCNEHGARLKIKLQEQTARFSSMSQLDQFSWAGFQTAVREIESALEQPARDGCDFSVLSAEVDAARSAWQDRLFSSQSGIFVSLFDSLAERRSPFTDQPEPSSIEKWAAARASDQRSRNWHRMLQIAEQVGEVVQQCPQSGGKPTLATKRTYEKLKQSKDQLLRNLPASLKKEAESAIREAESCFARYDERILTVRFESGCRYRQEITAANYDITQRGRLIKLEFDKQGACQNISSLVVEFLTEGYTVDARDEDGSPSDDESRRRTLEGDPVENLEGYRFYERLSAASKAFYLIEPKGGAASGKIYLRVVPRPF